MEWVVGDGGTVVDMTQTRELSAALSKYAEDSSLRDVHGKAALHRASATFGRDKVVREIVNMYRRIIAEDHRGSSREGYPLPG